MSSASRIRRPHARHAIGIALAATMLTTAGAAAQSPSTTPAPDATMLTTAGAAAQSPSTTPAPDATTAPGRTIDRPLMGHHRGLGPGRGWRDGRDPWGPGMGGARRGVRGFDGFGLRGPRLGSRVTVTANDGTDLVLATPDGWTRTIDTAGVVLTRDGVTIAIGDIQVGESVRVVQTRNADGSYTVTGIEVQPAVVLGSVGTASTDGFTVVGSDGTTTTVTVDQATTWWARGASSASIADATAGRSVAVQGRLQADGSILATRVLLG